ncbi:hypothetical protein ABZ756_02550 [Mammaliicoccus sciuri]
MEHLKINGYIVKVDKRKTKELYKELPLVSEKAHCGCPECSYYARAIMQTTPDIKQFFDQLGIDPRKEAEVWRAAKNEDGTYYYVADYHFMGEIQDVSELDWIEIDGAFFGLTNFTGNLHSSMIPDTFISPIVELIVRINLRSDF